MSNLLGWSEYNAQPWGRARLDLLHRLLMKVDLPRDAVVLDIGCGTGETARWLAERGVAVVAVDRSHEMIDAARGTSGRAGVDWLVGDIADLPQNLPQFDLVVCHNVLGYESDIEASTAVSNLITRTRIGGLLSVAFGNQLAEPLRQAAVHGDIDGAIAAALGRNERDAFVCGGRIRSFDIGQVEGWLEKAGCRVLRRTGVRVVFDFVPEELQRDLATYERLLELETMLGDDPAYLNLAVIIHVMASRGGQGADADEDALDRA